MILIAVDIRSIIPRVVLVISWLAKYMQITSFSRAGIIKSMSLAGGVDNTYIYLSFQICLCDYDLFVIIVYN
jgi:hypothetical protein